MMTVSVISWWYFLCCMAVINILAWSYAAVSLTRREGRLAPDLFESRRIMLGLSAVYVVGCAYRCVFLVYDVPRICLFDSWASSALVGRTVATLAELCFVAQWALLMRESSRITGSRVGRVVSLVLLPLIVVAETCSWYSVLTTSNLGHVAEESIWGASVALLVASGAVILPRCAPNRRPGLIAWCLAGLAYVAFMFLVDVPMYWARFIADEAVGRHYMSIAQGLADIAQRRVVSHRWHDWKQEVAWMSLYFSVAVWISIALVHVRPLETQGSIARPGSRPWLRALPGQAT
jgi:hypothetical protein